MNGIVNIHTQPQAVIVAAASTMLAPAARRVSASGYRRGMDVLTGSGAG